MIVVGYSSESSMVSKSGDDKMVPPRENAAPHSDSAAKPFFVMDWLDKVDEKDLALARRILQTPNKNIPRPNSQEVLAETKKTARSDEGGSPLPSPQKQNPSTFRERSIAIGNGWNAKGIKKAKAGKWEDALNCWKNALEIRTQVSDSKLDVANTCNNLGIALGRLERFDEALQYLERALETRTEEYGTRDRNEVATTLHNIGNVHQQANNLDAAIACFQEAQTIQVRLLGEHHEQVARSFAAIGNAQYQAKAYEGALQSYWDALTIFEKAGLPKTDEEVKIILGDVSELEQVLLRNRLNTQ